MGTFKNLENILQIQIATLNTLIVENYILNYIKFDQKHIFNGYVLKLVILCFSH